MKHVYYAVVLVVRPKGSGHQLLMARRADGKYMGGTWQLISGLIEPGETAWQAALREMWEETRLGPTEFYRLSTLTKFYRPDDDSINTAPMFCAFVNENAVVKLNPEHTQFEWINAERASSRLMWPSDRQALEEVRSVIFEGDLAKMHLRIDVDHYVRKVFINES